VVYSLCYAVKWVQDIISLVTALNVIGLLKSTLLVFDKFIAAAGTNEWDVIQNKAFAESYHLWRC
jgi:hypothetical protein